jgi:hypothetical protein
MLRNASVRRLPWGKVNGVFKEFDEIGVSGMTGINSFLPSNEDA